MGKTNALLDGRPLAGAVSWSLVSGVRAYTTVVTMSNRHAAEIFGAQKPDPIGNPSTPGPGSTGGGGTPKRPVRLQLGGGYFENVYILGRAPSLNPNVSAITIADRRWMWTYPLYKRSFNITRKVGDQRLTSPNQLDAITIDPQQAYKLWSLDEGRTKPWTAARVLADLADAIRDFEREEVGVAPEVILPDLSTMNDAALPIQNLELNGPLDASIERALAYLPGLDVYVKRSGAIEFFWRTNFDERDQIELAGPEVQNRGNIDYIRYARTRPRKFRVFFEIEAELKFEAREIASGTTSDFQTGPDDMYAENVLPIPDYSVTIRGQTLTTGCYLTMNDAFSAWGSFPGGFGNLTHQRACEWFVPFINAWDRLEKGSAFDANANWIARLGALRAHFRTTFRINPAWVDRFSSVGAYRVGTINTETGTRGAASVFSDFSYLPTQRSFAAELQNSNGHVFGYSYGVPGYPTGGVITDTTMASPATLDFLDSDQGVFHVTYNPDKFGLYTVALPSQIETRGANTQPGRLVSAAMCGPKADRSLTGRQYSAFGFNLIGRYHEPAQLTAAHALIAIVTATPGSPNSKRSLAYVDIHPNDVLAFPGQENCEGPTREVFIPASMETARIAWRDDQADRIKEVFTNQIEGPIGKDTPFPLVDLVLNYGRSGDNAAGAVSLFAIAKAEASRQWTAERDRWGGSATFGYYPDAQMRGAITAVAHQLEATGALTTRYDLPGTIEPLVIDRFLPSSLVRIMRRILKIGGR